MDFLNGVVRKELEILAVDGEVVDVAGFKNLPKFLKHVGTFVLELFEFWREEDDVVSEAFEESGFGFDCRIDDKSIAIAIGGGGEEIDVLFQMSGGEIFSDTFSNKWLNLVRTYRLDEIVERGFL